MFLQKAAMENVARSRFKHFRHQKNIFWTSRKSISGPKRSISESYELNLAFRGIFQMCPEVDLKHFRHQKNIFWVQNGQWKQNWKKNNQQLSKRECIKNYLLQLQTIYFRTISSRNSRRFSSITTLNTAATSPESCSAKNSLTRKR